MTQQDLSLNQKIGQLFFIGIPGPEVDESTSDLLSEVSPGGVCLFARNIREADQTRRLLDDIRKLLPVEPFLSIDQEGGLVDRLRRIMTPMPAANKINDTADAARFAGIVAGALRLFGFNMDFAPVVDVINAERSQYSNGLFSRAYGSSKEDVVSVGGAFLDTLQQNGIIGCLKHFPGLGGANVDSHEELPQVDIALEEFETTDLYPYHELIASGQAKAVMTAHAAFPRHSLQETDQNGKLLPSSLSKSFISTLLRGELQFDGLVITDDLEMGAIVKNYGVGQACKMAILAGVDMPLICADPQAIRDGYDAVLAAVNSGEIAGSRIDESQGRIEALKGQLSEPLPFDAERLQYLSDEVATLNADLNRD